MNSSLKKRLSSLALTLAFGLASVAQTFISADLAAPSGTVNQNEPGFLVYSHQMPEGLPRDPRHDVAEVERQLAGLIMDPLTGTFVENYADLFDTTYPAAPDDRWIVEGTINFSEETDPLFGGLGNNGNFTPDDKYPAIPGQFTASGGGLNDFAIEVTGFLQLSAGLHRLGVNSNDGFRFTIGIGTNPKDKFAFQPEGAVWPSSRAFADSEWELEVEAGGLYPFRLIHWEGADNSGVEFYSVNPPEEGGEKILINDPDNPNSIKSFRSANTTAPWVKTVQPAPGASDVFPQPTVLIEIEDGSRTVDAGSIQLTFDGEAVTAQTSKSGSTTTVTFETSEVLPADSSHTVSFGFSDSGGAARSHEWEFSVAALETLPGSLAIPLSERDSSAPGFVGRVHQARQDAGLVPSVDRANSQLRGTLLDPFSGAPFANQASTSNFTVDGVINYQEEGLPAGHFTANNGYADNFLPGIPGTGGHDDQYAIEFVGYLELTQGIHIIGVNSQDGFDLSVGADARDVFDAQSLGQYDGVRPEPADDILTFVVEEDGLYSIRLIGYESGDETIDNGNVPTEGSGIEFFSIDAEAYAANPDTAERILINDPSNPDSIKAWQRVTAAPPMAVTSVFPEPGAASVSVGTRIEATIENLGAASAALRVNGANVNATTSSSGSAATLVYEPSSPFERGETIRVELTYGGETRNWSFDTSTGRLAILIVNGDEASASDFEIQRRLIQDFRFDVILVDDTTVQQGNFTIDDARELDPAFIFVSSTTLSTRVVAQPWHELDAPLVNVEQATQDDFQLSNSNGTVDGVQGVVEIVNADHPLAAEFPLGELRYMEGAIRTGVHRGLPVDGAAVIAHQVGNPNNVLIYGVETGTTLLDGTTAPDRRVQFGITGDNNFAFFNENGYKLFNAAVAWAMDIEPPAEEKEPGVFQAPVLADGNITLSWEGDGELEEAPSVTGPWQASGNQQNPQTISVQGDRFFRLKAE